MSFLNIIVRLVNKIIRSGYWYNNVLFRDCAKMWQYSTFNTDIVNIGSTSGLYAFNYEGLSIKGANWAIGSNPLSGDLAILKNYLSFLNPQGSIVIFPLCPFTSLSGSRMIDEDRYYSILYASSIPHYSASRSKKVSDILSNPLSIYPLVGVFVDLKHLIFKKKNRLLTEEELIKDAHNWMNGWANEFGITDWKDPLTLINNDAISDSITVIDEMISVCNERNIRPVFLIPPVNKQLLNLYSPIIREKVLAPIESFIKGKDVWYKDYMGDEMFIYDSSLFRNSFLLNEKGAKLFTKRVLTDLGIAYENWNTDSTI